MVRRISLPLLQPQWPPRWVTSGASPLGPRRYQPLRRLELAVEAALVADGGEWTTERVAEVRQRVGQDLFRDALMRYWGGRCAISGVGESALLRASHAKPWKAAGHRSSARELAGSSVLKSPS